MKATIKAAEGEAGRMLTAVAGTVDRAKTLDEALIVRSKLQAQVDSDPESLAPATQRVDRMLMGDAVKGLSPVSGDASELIANARARASDLISKAAAKARVFATEVAAFEAAPDLYKQRKTLEVYERLGNVRKYVIVGDPSDVIIEYITIQEGSLDRVLAEGVER